MNSKNHGLNNSTILSTMNVKRCLLIFTFSIITNLLCAQHLPGNSVYQTIKTADDVRLFTLDIGSKSAENTYLVLHGGFGAEHSYLLQAILPHTDKNRFILFDQRGSLRSPAPNSLITFKNFVEDVEQIRKEYGLKKINILAHSNGTTITLDYLYSYPESVNKLILIGCPLSIIDSKYFTDLNKQLADYQNELQLWQQRVESNIAEKVAKYGLGDDENLSGIESTLKQKIIYTANHTYLMNDIERTQNAFFNPEVYTALQQNESAGTWALRTSRMSQALTQTKNTVLIVVINGAHDFVDPLGHVWKEIDRQIEHLKYIMIPESGHNIWLDKPNEFREVLEGVLD